MADSKSAYQDGKLNIGPVAQVKAIHSKPQGGETVKKYTGSDLRNGTKGK